MHATPMICATAVVLSLAGWTRPGMEPLVLDARAALAKLDLKR
jgi:hypothetical protein